MMDFYLNSTIAGYLSCLPRQLFQHFKTKKRCHTTHGVCVSPPCLLSNEAPKKKEREKKTGVCFFFFVVLQSLVIFRLLLCSFRMASTQELMVFSLFFSSHVFFL
jgi:hypothetical protein